MDQTPLQYHPDNTTTSTRLVYQRWREGFATVLFASTMVLGLFALTPAIISSQNIYLSITFIGTYVAVGVITFIRFPYHIRMTVYLLMLYVLGLSELLSTGILGDSLFFFLTLLVLATMMLSPRAGIIATAVNMATFAVMGTLFLTGRIIPSNPEAMDAKLVDWLSAAASTLLFSIAIVVGFGRLGLEFSHAQQQVEQVVNELKNERNNLEKNVADRTHQLQQVNDIARSISSILEPQGLMQRVVEMVSREFECYHTAIYMLDTTGQWAELIEATGDAGRTMRENNYRLDVEGKSLVAATIRSRQSRIALDSGEDAVKFDNPLLGYTRSEAILPLLLGERVVGALDLQSTRTAAFKQVELDTMQNLANQVAIALENARLFQEAGQSLAEMQATQRQYLQGAWTSFAANRNLEYRLGDQELPEDSPEMKIPLALRNQIIGEITMSTNEEWTLEQKNVVESIAMQAALALENARLVEESQSLAAREKLMNEITAKVWASTSVDAILQTAVREIGRALDASEVQIEITPGEAHE